MFSSPAPILQVPHLMYIYSKSGTNLIIKCKIISIITDTIYPNLWKSKVDITTLMVNQGFGDSNSLNNLVAQDVHQRTQDTLITSTRFFMNIFKLKSQEYEFNSIQNELLWKLAVKMRNVAYFWTVMGLFALVSGIIALFMQTKGENLQQFFLGIFMGTRQLELEPLFKFVVGILVLSVYIILIGKSTFQAAFKLGNVVNSNGNDITYLMAVLRKLDRVCSLYYQLAVLLVVAIWINIIFT